MDTVHSAFGKADDLPSHGVELIAVAEVFTQPRTNLQAVFRVDAKVPAVEQGVDIGSEQQAVVEPVLAASGDGAYMRGLQNRRDVRSAYRTASMIGVQDNRLE